MMIQSCIMTTSQGTVTEGATQMEGRMKMELDGRRLWLLISIITGRLLVPSGRFLINPDDGIIQIGSWTGRVEYYWVGDSWSRCWFYSSPLVHHRTVLSSAGNDGRVRLWKATAGNVWRPAGSIGVEQDDEREAQKQQAEVERDVEME
jgi:hypothetical protein